VALGEVDGEPVVVSGGRDGNVRLWQARTGQSRGEPLEHVDQRGRMWWEEMKSVTAVALGDVDGEPVVVSGGTDGKVRLWQARTGQARGEPLEHRGRVTAVALGEADGEPVVVSGGRNGNVRLWQARTGEPRGEPLKHGDWVTAVFLGEVDGEPVVVSGGLDGKVRLWQARTGEPRGEPLEHGDRVTAVAFGDVDGEPVVVSGGGGNVRLWQVRTGEPRGEPLEHGYWVTAVAFGDVDGEPVVVGGSKDARVRVWKARSSNLRTTLPVGGSVSAIVLTAPAEMVVGSDRGLVAFTLGEAARVRCATLSEHMD
jgi:WD40 repeat protein